MSEITNNQLLLTTDGRQVRAKYAGATLDGEALFRLHDPEDGEITPPMVESEVVKMCAAVLEEGE